MIWLVKTRSPVDPESVNDLVCKSIALNLDPLVQSGSSAFDPLQYGHDGNSEHVLK